MYFASHHTTENINSQDRHFSLLSRYSYPHLHIIYYFFPFAWFFLFILHLIFVPSSCITFTSSTSFLSSPSPSFISHFSSFFSSSSLFSSLFVQYYFLLLLLPSFLIPRLPSTPPFFVFLRFNSLFFSFLLFASFSVSFPSFKPSFHLSHFTAKSTFPYFLLPSIPSLPAPHSVSLLLPTLTLSPFTGKSTFFPTRVCSFLSSSFLLLPTSPRKPVEDGWHTSLWLIFTSPWNRKPGKNQTLTPLKTMKPKWGNIHDYESKCLQERGVRFQHWGWGRVFRCRITRNLP